MTESAGVILPLKVATARASEELKFLYQRLERLEIAFDSVIERSSDSIDAESIVMLQELDILRQSVGALANYVQKISSSTNQVGVARIDDALQDVPLKDMAERLAGQQGNSKASGIAELF